VASGLPDLPPFDTRQVVERLQERGVESAQAGAIVDALVDATQRLVTKRDLEEATKTLATTSALETLATDIQKSINAATWKFLGGVGVILAIFRWLLPG
jgi:hypothetical protein